jgi:phosphomethylpyrimidine synthase
MSEFATAFPNSQKVFVDGPRGVRVPMREVSLSKGEASIRLYDTSGPQDHDVKHGLPKLREPWVKARRAASKASAERLGTGRCVTQPTTRAKGEITPEMEFIAVPGLPADFVRDEVARGRDHPSNNHLELEPMIIGRNFL